MEADIPFELQGLAGARRYQRWVSRAVLPFCGQRILEVGAGLGSMSDWLPRRQQLLLTESDPALLQRLSAKVAAAGDPLVGVAPADLADDSLLLLAHHNPDTVVSFNVLEHVLDDEAALYRLVRLLRASAAPGPRHLITFVPAHRFAFGAMDETFGHHRRYDVDRARFLAARVAPDAELTTRYFNAFGLFGWLVNGRLLRRPHIGAGAIAAFETLCPIVAPIDDFLHRALKLPFGQSLLFVLRLR